MIEYTPYDWFWQVAGDETRFWSSAAGAYVEAAPDGFTRIASEAELASVLRPYGLVGPVVLAEDVKAEAQRRIYEHYPEWRQLNMTARGIELQDIWREAGQWTEQESADAKACRQAWEWIKSVRAASDALEALSPIPTGYRNDENWPEAPSA
jgi:hypothetical protein